MAVQISGNDITVPRDGTFTRNVTIGGTLTYEDVTNIDSVGLVTARTGIEIGARPGVAASISIDGNMIVSGISTFGGDVQVPDKIIHSGDTNTAIRFPSADTITAETAGTERFHITSDGKVGINQTPTRELSVHSPNNNNALIHFTNDDTGETAADGILVGLDGNENMVINNQETGKTIYFYNGGSERLRIDSSGRVGINETSMSSFNSIADDLVISQSSGSAGVTIRTSTTGSGTLAFTDAADTTFEGDIRYVHDGDYMRFSTAGNERLRIDSNGLMGLGVTPTSHNNTTAFQIYDDYNSQGYPRIRLTNQSTGTTTADGYEISLDGSNLHAVHRQRENADIYFMTNNVEKLRITSSGEVRKPLNPVFHAFGGASNIATNTDIVFGQERFDVGSGYDTSTGEYTAPVTGYYHFYAQVYRNATQNDAWWGFYLDNGSGYSQISEARLQTNQSGDSGRGYATLQSSIYWYMTAGHKMKCRVGNTGTIHCNNTLSYFCGNLVG